MAVAFLAMWMPTRYTAPLRNLTDPILVPLSSWLAGAGQDLRRKATNLTYRPADGKTSRELRDHIEELERSVLSIQRQNDQLLEELEAATHLRTEMLGPRGRLIPADVLLRDAVPWRESRLIDRPANFEPKKQWAVSRLFIDRGRDALEPGGWSVTSLSSSDGRQLLHRSVLVGQVEHVGQVTARVRLLTDSDSRVPGQVFSAKTNRPGPTCTIVGRGPNRMVATNVARQTSREGVRLPEGPPAEVGDLVLSGPRLSGLPIQMLVGRVSEVRISDENAQVYELTVLPAVNYSDLESVFIVDPMPADGGGP